MSFALSPNSAAPQSALASVGWDTGEQIRLYFIDNHGIVQEYAWMNHKWVQGTVGTLKVEVAAGSALTAHMFKRSDNNTIHIRVYCQVTKGGELYIQELCYDQGPEWTLSTPMKV